MHSFLFIFLPWVLFYYHCCIYCGGISDNDKVSTSSINKCDLQNEAVNLLLLDSSGCSVRHTEVLQLTETVSNPAAAPLYQRTLMFYIFNTTITSPILTATFVFVKHCGNVLWLTDNSTLLQLHSMLSGTARHTPVYSGGGRVVHS